MDAMCRTGQSGVRTRLEQSIFTPLLRRPRHSRTDPVQMHDSPGIKHGIAKTAWGRSSRQDAKKEPCLLGLLGGLVPDPVPGLFTGVLGAAHNVLREIVPRHVSVHKCDRGNELANVSRKLR